MFATRLTLLCHAATGATRAAAFPADEPLDERGVAAASAMRAALRRADRASTSPALRARQTAEALGLAAAVDPLLRDCGCGRWTGMTLAEIEASEPDAVLTWIGDPAAAPHGGESTLDLLRRVGAWLDARRADGGHTIAVTHAAVIRAAVVHVLAADARSFWRIDVEPLAQVTLSHGGRHWQLRSLVPPVRMRNRRPDT